MATRDSASFDDDRFYQEDRLIGTNEDNNLSRGSTFWWKSSRNLTLLNVILSFVLGSLFGLFVASYSKEKQLDSYETGFSTDIESLRSSIEVVDIKFTGTLRYKDTDHLYIDLGPNDIRYFGDPSMGVDQAWRELIGDKAELRADHDTTDKFEDFPGDIIGPDVLHTLHCLNEVRKVLDCKYYYNRTLEELNRGKRVHIDHCLDHIRQIIQCHMDLTPVRTLYFEDINVEVGDFDQVHKCRDIRKLQEWKPNVDIDKDMSASGKEEHDGKARHLGYPTNDEALLPWDYRDSEFN